MPDFSKQHYPVFAIAQYFNLKYSNSKTPTQWFLDLQLNFQYTIELWTRWQIFKALSWGDNYFWIVYYTAYVRVHTSLFQPMKQKALVAKPKYHSHARVEMYRFIIAKCFVWGLFAYLYIFLARGCLLKFWRQLSKRTEMSWKVQENLVWA